MDIYFLTDKYLGARSLRGAEILDQTVAGALGWYGPLPYDELIQEVRTVFDPDIRPTEDMVRQSIRRLFEAGLLDKSEG